MPKPKKIVQKRRAARQAPDRRGVEHVRLKVRKDGSEEISIFGPDLQQPMGGAQIAASSAQPAPAQPAAPPQQPGSYSGGNINPQGLSKMDQQTYGRQG
jgi:hypothetical protein